MTTPLKPDHEKRPFRFKLEGPFLRVSTKLLITPISPNFKGLKCSVFGRFRALQSRKNYGRIDEIEVQIDDVQSQIRSIRQEKISGDNIYRLLLAFDQVYEAASEVERKEFMRAFIERIELFPEKQPDGNWIRKIIFNFPVPVNGTEVKELPLENETMVETVILLTRE